MNATPNHTAHREPSRYLISARETSVLVRDALRAGKNDLAVRMLTEAVARLIGVGGTGIPDDVLAEPASTGDRKWDVILATAWLYAMTLCGVEASAWMHAERLDEELLFGGDGQESKEFKDYIRRQTPALFLDRNILTRPRDWVNV